MNHILKTENVNSEDMHPSGKDEIGTQNCQCLKSAT